MKKKSKKRRAEELKRKINDANLEYDDLYTLMYVAHVIKGQIRN